jgi:hypothetical protein
VSWREVESEVELELGELVDDRAPEVDVGSDDELLGDVLLVLEELSGVEVEVLELGDDVLP